MLFKFGTALFSSYCHFFILGFVHKLIVDVNDRRIQRSNCIHYIFISTVKLVLHFYKIGDFLSSFVHVASWHGCWIENGCFNFLVTHTKKIYNDSFCVLSTRYHLLLDLLSESSTRYPFLPQQQLMGLLGYVPHSRQEVSYVLCQLVDIPFYQKTSEC